MCEVQSTPADAAAAVLQAPCLRELLDDLLSHEPGAWAAAVLDSIDGEPMDEQERELYLSAWDRQVAWTEGRRMRAMAAVAGREPEAGSDDWAREEVALALGISPASAAHQIAMARALDSHLWQTRAALELGEISVRHARDLVELTARLSVDEQVVVEERVFAAGVGRPLADWRRRIRREVLRIDTASAADRRNRAEADRGVELWPGDDGMTTLVALLPAAGAETVWRALTAQADRIGHDDERTADQRRADLLVGWAANVLADPTLPRRQGRPPRIQVTVGLATLLGLRDNPAELDGYGPIDADLARRLAAEGEWVRFTTGAGTGALIEVGRHRYRPSQALRDHLLGKHPTCSFPGCSVPAERCDVDHARPFEHGGPTDQHNCGPPCRRHHRAKTVGGFGLTRAADGSATWTTRAGRSRTEPPVRLAGD